MNTPPSPQRRKLLVTTILGLAALAGLVAAGWYWWEARWYEVTSNAYLTGNLVEVSAQIGGTVVWIGPEQNQVVAAGQELLRLADGDERQALALHEQELALAVQEVLVLQAQVQRLESEQRLRGITHKLAREEFERRERLHGRKMVSDEELDTARTHQQETLVMLETARLALQVARVRAGSADINLHPRVMAAAARLRSSYREWRKTRVIAPVNGEIARRRVQAGQRIQAGTPLFSIAERGSAWVEANFKETQLRHLRPGQAVTISSDLYGDEATFRGRVHSIGTGTGAVFSLLPPQNATGNWIKIVQRVPVRIELEGGYDSERPLPFGASVEVRVDTHDRSGPALVIDNQATPVADIDLYDFHEEGADELVARVIQQARQQLDIRQ